VRFCGSAYGSYNLLNKEIRLASPEIEVFLHELSPAVDDRLTGLRPGQRKDQEVKRSSALRLSLNRWVIKSLWGMSGSTSKATALKSS
jgi:hypothetical protein